MLRRDFLAIAGAVPFFNLADVNALPVVDPPHGLTTKEVEDWQGKTTYICIKLDKIEKDDFEQALDNKYDSRCQIFSINQFDRNSVIKLFNELSDYMEGGYLKDAYKKMSIIVFPPKPYEKPDSNRTNAKKWFYNQYTKGKKNDVIILNETYSLLIGHNIVGIYNDGNLEFSSCWTTN